MVDQFKAPAPAIADPVRTRQLWLTVFVVLLAAWIAQPFLGPIAWGSVLAIAEWHLFRRAATKLGWRRGWLALAFTLATAAVIILPLTLIATSLAAESQAAMAWVQQAQQHGVVAPSWLAGLPLAGGRLSAWWQEHLGTGPAAQNWLGAINAGSAFSWVRAIAGEAAKESGLFAVTLIALATLLANGETIGAHAKVIACRMFGSFGEDFILRLSEATRHTVAGTLLVSVIEGALIGVGYAVAGVPQPMLFAVATIVLALVPFGAWVAFGLAGLILIAQSHILAGALVIAFGVTVMAIGDNFVQPAVIGGAVELPFLLAMIGAFGGLAELGLVGLFIGPVIMVALLLIWREWTGQLASGPKPTQRKAR